MKREENTSKKKCNGNSKVEKKRKRGAWKEKETKGKEMERNSKNRNEKNGTKNGSKGEEKEGGMKRENARKVKTLKKDEKGKEKREKYSLMIYECPWDSLAWGQRRYYREGLTEGSRPQCVSPLLVLCPHTHTHTPLHCLTACRSDLKQAATVWPLTLF